MADAVLERRPVEQGHRQHVHRVEPATGLVETFGDKIGWETLHEFFVVDTEWVVTLTERHSSRLKPTVEYFWNPLEHTFAHFGRNRDAIDVLSVQVIDASDA